MGERKDNGQVHEECHWAGTICTQAFYSDPGWNHLVSVFHVSTCPLYLRFCLCLVTLQPLITGPPAPGGMVTERLAGIKLFE